MCFSGERGFAALVFFLHVLRATLFPNYTSFVGILTIWFFLFVLGNFSLGAFHGRLLKVFSLLLHKLNLIFSFWSRKFIRRDFCFLVHACLFLNYSMKRIGGALLIYYFICHSFIPFLLHAWVFCCLVFVF